MLTEKKLEVLTVKIWTFRLPVEIWTFRLPVEIWIKWGIKNRCRKETLMASVYSTAILITAMHGPADENITQNEAQVKLCMSRVVSTPLYNMKLGQSSTSVGNAMISGIGSAIVGSSSMSAQLMPVTEAVQKLLALVMA